MPKVNPFERPRKKPGNSGVDAPALAEHERDRKLPQKPRRRGRAAGRNSKLI